MSTSSPRLPDGWRWSTLAELADVVGGLAKGKKRPARSRLRSVPYLRVANVQRGHIDLTEVKTIEATETEVQELRLLPGDVLLNEGGDRDKLGRGWVWKGQLPECIHQNHVFRARVREGALLPELLSHYANSAGQHYFTAQGKQTTNLASISLGRLRGLPVPVPPVDQQPALLWTIDSHFSRLDAATATLERVQRNLERYRASVLKAAVEGRLVPTEAELAKKEGRTYEPASALLKRILTERRRRWEEVELAKLTAKGKKPTDDKWKAKYEGPAAPDTDGLPELPEGWCWATVGSVADCLDHLRVPVSKTERAKRSGRVPYFGANGRTGWIDEPLFNESLVLVVEDETFVGRTQPFSYVIDGPTWVNNHAHVLRARGCVTTEFLNASLMFYPFTPLTTGTTGRRKLTKKALMAAPFALPPLAEQARVTALLAQHESAQAAVNKTATNSERHLLRLRQTILKWAFEGRLVEADAQ